MVFNYFFRNFVFFIISFFIFNIFSLPSKEIKNSLVGKKARLKRYCKIYNLLDCDYEILLRQKVSDFIENFFNSNFKKKEKNEIYKIKYILKILRFILKDLKEKKMKKEILFFENIYKKVEDIFNVVESKDFSSIPGAISGGWVSGEKITDKNALIILFKNLMEAGDKKISEIDYLNISFLWIMYVYSKFISNRDYLKESELSYIVEYPIYKNKEIIAFQAVGIYGTIEKFIEPIGKTKLAKNQAINEISKRAINFEMHALNVEKRNALIRLFCDERNKDIVDQIKKELNDISKILKNLEEKQKGSSVGTDFQKIDKFFKDSVNNDLFKKGSLRLSNDITNNGAFLSDLWQSKLFIGKMFACRCFDYFIPKEEDIDDIKDFQRFESKSFISIFFPSIFSWRRTIKDSFLDIDNKSIGERQYVINVMPLFMVTLGATIGDRYRFLKTVGLGCYNGLGSLCLAGQYFLLLAPVAWNLYYYTSRFNFYKNQISNFSEICEYIKNISELTIKTKKISDLISKLYEKNRISEELFIPELISLKNIFKRKGNFLNNIKNCTSSFFNKSLFYLKTSFFPALFAKKFFNEFDVESYLFTINKFIGAIDLNLIKKHLIENDNFCIPKIIYNKTSNAKLSIKDAWFGNLRSNEYVYNDIDFGDENYRNAMIVAPTAGGKTVLISTIISSLYLSNMVIVTAREMEFTLFNNIMDNVCSVSYEVGDGASGYLSEKNMMDDLKKIVKDNIDNGIKTIIFIDEIYKGTRADLAVVKAEDDLRFFINNKNVIFILTTHIIDLSKIVSNYKDNMLLYYLQVDEISKGKFINKFKFKKDDEDNWWLKDFEKAKRYLYYQEGYLN